MDWLQSLDVSVFRFVNHSLSNPFFDRLMPFLSGNVFFYPVLVALAAWMIYARWTLESQGAREKDARSDSGTGIVAFDVRRRELREELVYQPRPNSRFSGIVARLLETNEATGAGADGLQLGVTTTFAVARHGRFRGGVDGTHPTDFRGLDLGDRFRTKETDEFEWRGSFDVRVSEWMNASLSYSGRTRDGVPTTHLARAEARALF
jgi:hypothetical protein